MDKKKTHATFTFSKYGAKLQREERNTYTQVIYTIIVKKYTYSKTMIILRTRVILVLSMINLILYFGRISDLNRIIMLM